VILRERVLLYIAEHPGCRPAEVARAMGKRPSEIARVITLLGVLVRRQKTGGCFPKTHLFCN
jgi:hypothetical protein